MRNRSTACTAARYLAVSVSSCVLSAMLTLHLRVVLPLMLLRACCIRLFDELLQCKDAEFIMTASWAFDLINEFVYQVSSLRLLAATHPCFY